MKRAGKRSGTPCARVIDPRACVDLLYMKLVERTDHALSLLLVPLAAAVFVVCVEWMFGARRESARRSRSDAEQ
jgi:hypothetical protein